MKKNIFKILMFLFIGSLTTSCFGDLDTMPLDETQLVGEKVYSTADDVLHAGIVHRQLPYAVFIQWLAQVP